MRVALTGSHRTGKTTLMKAIVDENPKLSAINEPFYHLKNNGNDFSNPLSLSSFTAQLEYSIQMLAMQTPNSIFDRCPLDFLGYIACHQDAGYFDFGYWVPKIQQSLRTIDLLVYVPIETPDRIDLMLSYEDMEYRSSVDTSLKGILDSRVFKEVGINFLTVTGSVDRRVRRILDLEKSRYAHEDILQ